MLMSLNYAINQAKPTTYIKSIYCIILTNPVHSWYRLSKRLTLLSNLNFRLMKINRSKAIAQEPLTVIAAGTTFTGRIESNQTVRIEGNFIGDINGTGKVITCPDSSIQGNVEANELIVGGNIKGELSGFTSITIQNTGVVEGTIQSDTIVIEKGGLFEGDCVMYRKEIEVIEMGPHLLEKQA